MSRRKIHRRSFRANDRSRCAWASRRHACAGPRLSLTDDHLDRAVSTRLAGGHHCAPSGDGPPANIKGTRSTTLFATVRRSASGVAFRQFARARISRIPWPAPLPPRGYIGWAASPSRVTRPKVHCWSGSRSTIGHSSRMSWARIMPETSSQGKHQSANVGKKSSRSPCRFQSSITVASRLNLGNPIDHLQTVGIDVVSEWNMRIFPSSSQPAWAAERPVRNGFQRVTPRHILISW
jgi:hypothetical protein